MTKRHHKVLAPRGTVPRAPPAAEEAIAPLLILHAQELVTMAGEEGPRRGRAMRELRVIPDGGLYASEGAIRDVGSSHEMESRYSDVAEVIDATGKTVVPGFVDAHTHLVFAGSREDELEWKAQGLTYAEIAERGGGILRTVKATRAAPEEGLYVAARARLDVMLAHGTTTVEGKTGYGLTIEDEMKMLRVLERLQEGHPATVVPTFLGAHAVPPEYEGRADEYVDLLAREALPSVAAKTSARFCDVFVEDGYFSGDQARRLLSEAERLGLSTKLHADEFSDGGGAALAAEVGASTADHLVYASSDGIRKMAERGSIAVLLPASSLASRIPFAKGRHFVDMGVPVALGSDFSPNCWTESMGLVVSLAAHQLGLTPAEALTAATINGAHAVGLGREVGSLEVGKRADLLVLDVPDHRHLAYRIGGRVVETVIKDGRVVLHRVP
ncbi:MAG TPA: imidazolonepropionase [Thermoplasmata archaeon]|jgi:imidazolonepropionase|nr:imidazolonepropionase [Thermoplasmata archaeon]